MDCTNAFESQLTRMSHKLIFYNSADLIFMVTAMTRMTTRMAATTPHRMLMKGLFASPRPSWSGDKVKKRPFKF